MTARTFWAARETVLKNLKVLLGGTDFCAITKVVLVDDLNGRLRIVVWTDNDGQMGKVWSTLRPLAGVFAGSDPIKVHSDCRAEIRVLAQEAEKGAIEVDGSSGKLFVVDRHRNRGGWFLDPCEPSWPLEGSRDAPPIVLFYSFKGGVGRSTALVGFALQRARAGEKVVILDLDLDAPGLLSLLPPESALFGGLGIVDYLIDQPFIEAPDLTEYNYEVPSGSLTGDQGGSIRLFPAGRLDDSYVNKLGRLDFDRTGGATWKSFDCLMRSIRETIRPDWILCDSRTGLADTSTLFLSGFAHLHVLVGTGSAQNWDGMRQVLKRLGADRLQIYPQQAEIIVVNSMIPAVGLLDTERKAAFVDALKDLLSEVYLAKLPQKDDSERTSPDESLAYDLEKLDEPEDSPGSFKPVMIEYDTKIVTSETIADYADTICAGPHRALGDRIVARVEIMRSKADTEEPDDLAE